MVEQILPLASKPQQQRMDLSSISFHVLLQNARFSSESSFARSKRRKSHHSSSHGALINTRPRTPQPPLDDAIQLHFNEYGPSDE
ncbi:hypothetical protein CDAR_281251 [Caerostris darwini]|uniref:Uncharacterized protein n=1 Tax=Caerostris darwini TaxID=1538125 RepID=A0AAV4WWF7_9ARAC|nr:hypothetical protein CDAR_281251 [Caerostris darwini]